VIALLDASLSMQWDKLDTGYLLLEKLLRSLRTADRFNVVLFNSAVTAFTPAPGAADAEAVDRALTFVRRQTLRGGSDIAAALDRALDMTGPNTYVVLLTDGGATDGLIGNAGLEAAFTEKWRRKRSAERPRLFVFGVGGDANVALLRRLGALNGVFEWASGTESADFKIAQFLAKIGRFPIANLRLDASPSAGLSLIYPLEDSVFGGSRQVWIGQYRSSSPEVRFTATGERDGKTVTLTANAPLPGQSSGSPELPRTWARARVDALLDKIDREGEDQAAIEEIIALSRKYKFVTPYTSFLAAPRALLRPRLIQPGDPILRVKTDPRIKSVIAVFPFGTVETLRLDICVSVIPTGCVSLVFCDCLP
jgi:Ca-activated chloride channel family protein